MGGSSHSQTFLLDTWNNRDGPTRKMEVMVGQNDWVTWSNILIVIAFMMVVLWAGDDIFFMMILMIIMAIMIIMTETVISKDSAFSLCSTVVENICKGK